LRFYITQAIRHIHPTALLAAHRRGRYVHNTQQTQEKNTLGIRGIRNSDPGNRVTANSRQRTTWSSGSKIP